MAEAEKDVKNSADEVANEKSILISTPRLRGCSPEDEASYGADHPNVARGLSNLAGLLRVTNRLSEAEPMYRRDLAILVQRFRSSNHMEEPVPVALPS
jgi:hypothetical protein